MPMSCFFLAVNSSSVMMPESRRSLYFLISATASQVKKQMKIWLKQKKQLLKLHLQKQKTMHSTVDLKTIQQMKTNRYEGFELSLT